MHPNTAKRQTNRWKKMTRYLLLLPMLIAAPAVQGTPPITPLPLPDYSFDLGSPSVPGGVGAADILTMTLDSAWTQINGINLGLSDPNDDLDALSAANPFVAPDDPFVLLFSVDRDSPGTVEPDQQLFYLEVPYNVYDQAERGHAAGDEYMSGRLYTRMGVKARGGRPDNNTLNRNNYDEGGTSYGAVPPVAARERTGRAPQDNVDANALLTRNGGDAIVEVYFSATSGSPSVISGADIMFNPAPEIPMTSSLYASYYDLGLDLLDDIDGMIVFDTNEDGTYNGSDEVIFSLAPGSPSLDIIPGASLDGPAADVFVVIYGQSPELFAAANEYGLGYSMDNIDALDYDFCDDPIYCATQHGIRELFSDLNCDGSINSLDIDPFVLVLTGTPPDYPEYHSVHGDCDHRLADCNKDGSINSLDIDAFVVRLTSP